MPTIKKQQAMKRKMLWEITKIFIKHYRIRIFPENKELYNKRISNLMSKYRELEYKVNRKNVDITKKRYLLIIKSLEKN